MFEGIRHGTRKGRWFWKGCSRILSAFANGENHLSERPIPETCFAFTNRSGQLLGFLFGLAPDGVFRAALLAASRGGLLHHLFTLAASNRRGGLIFCGHFPSESLQLSARGIPINRLGLRGITPAGVRTSSPACAGSDSPPFQNRREYNAVGDFSSSDHF